MSYVFGGDYPFDGENDDRWLQNVNGDVSSMDYEPTQARVFDNDDESPRGGYESDMEFEIGSVDYKTSSEGKVRLFSFHLYSLIQYFHLSAWE